MTLGAASDFAQDDLGRMGEIFEAPNMKAGRQLWIMAGTCRDWDPPNYRIKKYQIKSAPQMMVATT
jgi:hypothetical protein